MRRTNEIFKGMEQMRNMEKKEENRLPTDPEKAVQMEKRMEENAAAARADRFLRQYSCLNAQIERKLWHQEQLRNLAARCTGDFTMPVGSGWKDSRSAAAAQVLDLEAEIDRDIDRLVLLRKEAERVLGQMKNQDAAMILDYRYIQGCTVKQAAANTSYSERHTSRLVRKGLLEVDRILREDK